MAKSEFYNKIEGSTNEQMVANVYNEYLKKWFNVNRIEYPHECDGVVENDKVKLIMEYKADKDLGNPRERAKVLSQVVYYLKRFDECGEVIPNVCLVGDVNECFVMHTNELLKYLDEDYDWTFAPSTAYMHNADIVDKIANDDNINPFVFDVNDSFKFNAVVMQINSLATGVPRHTRITEHNMAVAFADFKKKVIKDKSLTSHELVSIFVGVLTDPIKYFKHPSVSGYLVATNMAKLVAIDGKNFDAFFSRYFNEYSPKERERFTEISDRLVDDEVRRRNGDYYTPVIFADYAHKMLSEKFGDDWKEKYTVWDCCCGTKNLTKGHKFSDLYCSTLEEAELARSEKYNKEGTAFPFDFLNDPIDKLPNDLKKALENNKPIIFLFNPPYATTCNFGDKNKAEEGNDTMINGIMKDNGMKRCSDNLYAQFLYRIMMIKTQYNLTDCNIGLFSPTLFLTGSSFSEFRKVFLKDFSFTNAVQFKASHFADVKDSWGISFSIWANGETIDKHNFNYTLIDNVDGEIVKIGEKVVYNIDGETTASEWVKKDIKKIKTEDAPQMTSGIKYKPNKDGCRGNLVKGAIGFFYINSNNIDKNAQNVGMFTSCFSSGTGCSVLPTNFTKCTALFSARRLVSCDWINWADEYLAPNTENENYKEFENDSIIYSLFESKSNQSSLRNIDYKGRKWDIKNEFFFMGKDEIETLANKNGNDECYNDCKGSEDRYVYKYLNGLELSEEAKNVLDKAIEIVRKTFKYRKEFNTTHPEYQINNWDCGWYQIKALAKEYCEKDLNEFKELYNKLADKMRPMVYELGFLK